MAFNMMAFVPIGTSLERMQGTLALIHLISLLMFVGGGAYVGLATAAAYIPWRYALAPALYLPEQTYNKSTVLPNDCGDKMSGQPKVCSCTHQTCCAISTDK